jgi:hypothetical protein
LLQRFQLAVWPDSPTFETIDEYPNKEAKTAAAALFDRISAGFFVGHNDDYSKAPFLRLSNDAQELFYDWYNGFMAKLRAAESGGESAALCSHRGKYPGLLGKLSLILSVCDDPDSTDVSETTMQKALAWLEYLDEHAKRLYHYAGASDVGVSELLLARLKRGDLPRESFKSWQIARKNWSGLGDREAVKRACRLLFEHGWLVETDPGGATGGRPSDPVYMVPQRLRA